MGTIHRLSEDLRNKIAAGEVVERPASVVKELVENSLDAGATRIEVAVEAGGLTSILVRDDGCGIPRDELLLAFERHTSSKVSEAEDLERIRTHGFRGEALSSIAAVARVEAISSADSAGVGSAVVFLNGCGSAPSPCAAGKGTTITVTDLFLGLPARRKFLKTPQVELRHVAQWLKKFSLAYPEVGFTLVADGEELLHRKPEPLEERIIGCFDESFRGNLLPIDSVRPPFRVSGYLGSLSLVRKRRGDQHFFVNRRAVSDPLLTSAVYSAYASLTQRGEYPFFVLLAEVPPDQVDANVHPAKLEVRFRDEWRIYHTVKLAVGEAIRPILQTIPQFTSPSSLSPPVTQIPQPAPSPSPSPYPGDVIARGKAYVQSLAGREGPPEVLDLENIWQVHRKYIISQVKSGLVMIDQHAAHERILFDQAMAALETHPISSQVLLFPEILEFPAEDFTELLELVPSLEKVGFRLREIGRRSLVVDGVPPEVRWGREKSILTEILNDFREKRKLFPSFMHGVAASYSCKAAVKAGDELTREEMQGLVDRLFATRQPYHCPHGRPIIISLSLQELDRRFERS